MKLIRNKYIAVTFLAAFLFSFYSVFEYEPYNNQQECFMVLAGKEATHNGKVMLAHNNDLTGKEVSLVEIIPENYDSGIISVEYSNGLRISLSSRTYKVLIQRIEAGYAEGDAVAINQFGVAIAGGVALGSDRNQKAIQFAPLSLNGLPGGIRYDILARSKTARECVKMLGETYSKYGVSYPSGVGIADSNEIWYIECGGGKQWAAIRIPDSCYWVQANGYRIGEIDTTDKEYFLTSPGLFKFCATNELWDPGKDAFNFAKIFGGGRSKEDGGIEYDRLRVWRGIDLLSPSLGLKPDTDYLPIYLVPDKNISELDLFAVLRDFYSGTKIDRSHKDPLDETTRSIATWRGVHSSLIVITPSKLIESAAILWSGIGPSLVTGFTPIPFGVNRLPQSYNSGDSESAFFKFSQLAEYSSDDWEKIIAIQKSFEENEYIFLKQINQLLQNENLIDNKILNLFTDSAATRTIELADQLTGE